MIKVLKLGTKKKVECNKCGALLEYEKEDIQEHQIGLNAFYGLNEFYEYIVCPECKYRIGVRGIR